MMSWRRNNGCWICLPLGDFITYATSKQSTNQKYLAMLFRRPTSKNKMISMWSNTGNQVLVDDEAIEANWRNNRCKVIMATLHATTFSKRHTWGGTEIFEVFSLDADDGGLSHDEAAIAKSSNRRLVRASTMMASTHAINILRHEMSHFISWPKPPTLHANEQAERLLCG